MTSDVGAARIAASWIAVAYLAEHGAAATSPELAAAAGISERTFYRYFPAREDVLRPAMQDSQTAMAAALVGQPDDVPLGDALVAAFAASAEGEYLERTRGLLPVVLDNAKYLAVWSQELHRHQPALLAAIADRLGCSPDAEEADVAATLYLTLMESALVTMIRTGEHPAAVLRRLMGLVDSSLMRRTP